MVNGIQFGQKSLGFGTGPRKMNFIKFHSSRVELLHVDEWIEE
jgi:hypothetical protein